jgi:hypothetical protein
MGSCIAGRQTGHPAMLVAGEKRAKRIVFSAASANSLLFQVIRAVAALSPLHHPADRCSGRNTCRQRYCDRFKRVSLHAPLCVVKNFGSGVGAISCRASSSRDTVVQRIRNSRCRPGSFVRCIVNLLAHVCEF